MGSGSSSLPEVVTNELKELTDEEKSQVYSQFQELVAHGKPEAETIEMLRDVYKSRCRHISNIAESHWIKLKPSITVDESGIRFKYKSRGILNRKGMLYDSDSPHLISPGLSLPDLTLSTDVTRRKLVVHIPGTGSSPTVFHESTYFLKAAHNSGMPCIGLSYEWANFADQEKNKYCENFGNNRSCQETLEAYHSDVCFGGCTPPLTNVDISGSILGRLAAVLLYLVKTRPQSERWTDFITEEASTIISDDASVDGDSTLHVDDIINSIRWSCIVLSGHSQGSGHAAFIAQRVQLARLVLFSGPQEGYVVDPDEVDTVSHHHWLCDEFKTQNIFAMMHKHEEGTAGEAY